MVNICFYFQVHQPFRLAPFQVFDIGSQKSYFDIEKNKAIMKKVASKCYLPANATFLELLNRYPEMKISFSFSGVFLEQCELYAPEVLASFQRLVKTGQVEILAETYYHSLAFLYDEKEFETQVKLHREKVQDLFNVTPTIFRNTELIYNNALARKIEELGYKAILLEGWDNVLKWRSPNFVYKPVNANIPLLLKNYRLSDDIAFRFSNKEWKEHPLSVEKFSGWVNDINGNGDTVNLFMDYETFGEHQWADTGIFEFLRHLPEELLKHPDNRFSWPSEVAAKCSQRGELDIHHPLSWADMERDVSAWLGNSMQQAAIAKLYSMGDLIKQQENSELLEIWRKMQTSDHFYYMCTKWFSDGDVHKYFNPYQSPYDGFIYFMNIFKDLQHKVQFQTVSNKGVILCQENK
ncbi:alpha-amylase [Candidatus Woesearchaeota archaeon]|jgi:alpha-amylase|nr:alpha-amylase [Candidatus Woesearchaeota archaeon]MBT5740349.1 alpha-amylase [Candidatus Woesearchaeota archaeon]